MPQCGDTQPILRALGALGANRRRTRFSRFLALLRQLPQPITVLDVGGTESLWRLNDVSWMAKGHVQLLNLVRVTTTLPGFCSVIGNATCLQQYRNREFDVVFSNSVIEHVGGWAKQQRMAEEISRVGKRYYVQTPNRSFPLEPHFCVPFFAVLPRSIRVQLVMRFALGWRPQTRNRALAEKQVDSVRLLSRPEILQLFPGARYQAERFLGLTKSHLVMAGWN